jgi:hypothetical protein
MPLVEIAPHWECELCGLACGWVDDDLPDDEEEVGVPAGWVRMDMKMKGLNPELAVFRQSLDALVAQTAQMFAPDGGEIAPEHFAMAREIVEQQSSPPPATIILVDASFCLCRDCKPALVDLEIKDFEDPTPEAPAAAVPTPAPAPAPVAVEPAPVVPAPEPAAESAAPAQDDPGAAAAAVSGLLDGGA